MYQCKHDGDLADFHWTCTCSGCKSMFPTLAIILKVVTVIAKTFDDRLMGYQTRNHEKCDRNES